MANVETMGLGPQKSMFVLVIIVGCFAALWPRILSPMFVGPPKESYLSPNTKDKASGCCDVIFETDIDAIKIMTEVCGNILRGNKDGMDSKMEQALQSGKLTKDIISTCRQEVNRTCGVDIALFLTHNIALGKTYRQILDDVRSYNSSNCLKMNYGVAPWSLGVPHLVGKFWMEGLDSQSVRQERPPHLRHTPMHPALRERGRAIPASPVPHPTVPIVQQGPMQGRVWPSQLHVYLSNYTIKPITVRPPMGGAGRVVSPPKSSVGFLMPLYTLCIVIFFFYTIFKMVFRKGSSDSTIGSTQPLKYIPDRPESEFRQTVFKGANKSSRMSPEPSKFVVNAISGLVAEVQQQMDEETTKIDNATLNQERPPHPYTNGSVPQAQREVPILSKSKDFSLFKETTPPSWEASTPVHREETVLAEEFTPSIKESSQREPTPPPKEPTPPPKELTPPPKELTPPPKELTPPPKELTPPPKELTPLPKELTPPPKELTPPPKHIEEPVEKKVSNVYERAVPLKEASPLKEIVPGKVPEDNLVATDEEEDEEYEEDEEVEEDEEIEEERVVEKIGEKHEMDIPEKPLVEDQAIRQLRTSVEKENATVKVLGMEMRAHCEGGKKWSQARPPTPPTAPPSTPPPLRKQHQPPPRHPTPPVEVSSIYLEGALPHQSRLLVADSETHTEQLSNGDDKDPPIVLSGKMTLSLINDSSTKSTPERDFAVKDDTYDDDDEFLTASAATAPKQEAEDDYEDGSEEEVEEEEEMEEDEVEKDVGNNVSDSVKVTENGIKSIDTDNAICLSEEEEDVEEDLEEEEEVEEIEEDDEIKVEEAKTDAVKVEEKVTEVGKKQVEVEEDEDEEEDVEEEEEEEDEVVVAEEVEVEEVENEEEELEDEEEEKLESKKPAKDT